MGLRFLLYGSLALPGARYPDMLIQPDPVVGWVMQPDQIAHKEKLDYSILVRSNSRGFADVDHPYEKPEGVFRVVVLGDSFMEGAHVNEGERFVDRLNELLAPHRGEVINLGIGAYGTAQQWLMLRHEGLRYEPDLVLLALYAENDLHDNHRGLSAALWGADDWRTFSRPFAVWDAERQDLVLESPDFEQAEAMYQLIKNYRRPFWERIPLLETSVTSQAWRKMTRARKTRVFMPGDDPNIAFGAHLLAFNPELRKETTLPMAEYEAMWHEARAVTYELVKAVHREAREAGVPFVLFTVPAKSQVEPLYLEAVQKKYPGLEFDLRRTEKDLLALGDAEALHVLDLTPPFREEFERSGEPLHYYRDDSHWNPQGHAFAAREVFNYLEALGLLPPAQ